MDEVSHFITELDRSRKIVSHYVKIFEAETKTWLGHAIPCPGRLKFSKITEKLLKEMRSLYTSCTQELDNEEDSTVDTKIEGVISEDTDDRQDLIDMAWKSLNVSIMNRFINSFTDHDATPCVYDAFLGNKDAYEKYTNEIDILYNAIMDHEGTTELLDRDEQEYLMATIRIFREIMEISTEPYARRLLRGPVCEYCEAYARTFGYVWVALSVCSGYMDMDHEDLKRHCKQLKNITKTLGDCDYAINIVLANYCTGLDAKDSDTFYDMAIYAIESLEALIADQEKEPKAERCEDLNPDNTATVYDDLMAALRGVDTKGFSDNDENLAFWVDGLCTELVENMFFHPTETKNIGVEPWLSPLLIGVCQELFLVHDKVNHTLLTDLCHMLADILKILVKAKYYPNIPQRKYHLPEFDNKAVSVREIKKLKDASLYVLNHIIYEMDEACGIDCAKIKGSCFIHISEFAHYGLTCALRYEKVMELRDTAKELKEVAELTGKPIITAEQKDVQKTDEYNKYDPEDDPEYDPTDYEDDHEGDFTFEEAHDQMVAYAAMRKKTLDEAHDQMMAYAAIRKKDLEKTKESVEDWLANDKVPVVPVAIAKETINHLKYYANKHVKSIKDVSMRLRKGVHKKVQKDKK